MSLNYYITVQSRTLGQIFTESNAWKWLRLCQRKLKVIANRIYRLVVICASACRTRAKAYYNDSIPIDSSTFKYSSVSAFDDDLFTHLCSRSESTPSFELLYFKPGDGLGLTCNSNRPYGCLKSCPLMPT